MVARLGPGGSFIRTLYVANNGRYAANLTRDLSEAKTLTYADAVFLTDEALVDGVAVFDIIPRHEVDA